jgi:hypothetical protein
VTTSGLTVFNNYFKCCRFRRIFATKRFGSEKFWWNSERNLKTASGGVVGWRTMLQAGRSPVRVPDEVNVCNLVILPTALWPWGWTHPLTKMSTRNLTGGKKWPTRRAENLAAICEPNVWKSGSLNLSRNPKGLHDLYRDNFNVSHFTVGNTFSPVQKTYDDSRRFGK